MKFVTSYSGGKESALALYRMIKQGHEPIALITTYNDSAERSHFHGLPEAVLKDVSDALGIPLWLIKTKDENYAKDFEAALLKAKEQGAQACVFGDIDIEGHRAWCTERCDKVGISAAFPLWGESRKDVVKEVIDSGFVANITTIDTKYLSQDFLGQQLTASLATCIANSGADICGENGEYHTFVSDGPIFTYPIEFAFGQCVSNNNYLMLSVESLSKSLFKI
ncbi:MAG: diphthine--ammonia ligase [Defluviitaleaceae bacterium]|nr:diphthine--ammonia ligase [Defluviitaleaceae bacterium]